MSGWRWVAWGIAALFACGGGQRSSEQSPAPQRRLLEKLIASSDVKLFVRDVGPVDGSVMLVIHGGPGFSHDYLIGVEALVPPQLRVVGYDQRGGNRSSPASSFTLADELGDIEAIRADLGAERMHLFGHSWVGSWPLPTRSSIQSMSRR